MSVLERDIERRVVRGIAKWGIHSIKLNGRGQTGWPDRLFLLPMGRVVFVEFKKPGGRLSAKQKVMIDLLEKAEHRVVVCDNYDDAMRLILWAHSDARLT